MELLDILRTLNDCHGPAGDERGVAAAIRRLAEPYVLGVSSGASLGATLAILVGVGSFLGSGYVGLVAFAGAFLVSMGVIALANIGGRATSVKLILAGTALSAICAAVSNFFLYVINTSSGALEAPGSSGVKKVSTSRWPA